MKKVAIVYRNSDNPTVIKYIQHTIEQIFEQLITVQNYYLPELPESYVIKEDACIIVDSDLLHPLRNHIPSFKNIIMMNRSINRARLARVFTLPPNSDVLLVNDTYESAVETAQAFYELGISHLNMIPFDPADPDNCKYADLQTAITPEELELVPSHIKEIINIGYRQISFGTLLKLMTMLKLETETTNRNLIRHMRSVLESNTGFHNNYLNNFLKSQVLNQVINDSASALLVCNEQYDLVYFNEKSSILFQLKDIAMIPISQILPKDLAEILQSESGEPDGKYSAHIGDDLYFIEKTKVSLMEEVIGYYFLFRNEKDLRDLELNAQTILKTKGQFAKYHFSDIVHCSEIMKGNIEMAKRAALTDYTILIIGESGTGKELLAQSIHNYSPRSALPFVAVNCAALSESLLESELFGYEGGAFTGARKSGKLGLFEQAGGGTIFLDEIGDISPKLQSQLLRVLQERQIMRIGSDRVISINTRIIAATNKDLQEAVTRGDFRKDLFYRLNIINLPLPPLRERPEDIIPLLSVFLGQKIHEITESQKKFLTSYYWPGNIRELENATIYYKAMSVFPELKDTDAHPAATRASSHCKPGIPQVPENQKRPPAINDRSIRSLILQLLSHSTQRFHGIGKERLREQLCDYNIHIGSGNLARLLKQLEEESLVTISKGRGGTAITQKGLDFLKKSND